MPRSGCPGRDGACGMSYIVWNNLLSFVEHYKADHLERGFHQNCPIGCYGSWVSDTTSPARNYENGIMLARHIWSKHLHREKFRDPSLPRLAEANQAKAKSAESSKMAQEAQATTEFQTSGSEQQGKLGALELAATDNPDNAERRLHPRTFSRAERRRKWFSQWRQRDEDPEPDPAAPSVSSKVKNRRIGPSEEDEWVREMRNDSRLLYGGRGLR